MKYLVYDFFDANMGAFLGFLGLVCFGILGAIYSFYFVGKQQTDLDGEQVLIKTLPVGKRLAAAAIPLVIMGMVTLFGAYNFAALLHFDISGRMGNCQQVQGCITAFSAERKDYRDNEMYKISFCVDSVEFSELVNTFFPEELRHLKEGAEVFIEYGYLQGKMTIYRIYTMA